MVGKDERRMSMEEEHSLKGSEVRTVDMIIM